MSVIVFPIVQNNEAPKRCGSCGHCCESEPGITWPLDWGESKSAMRKQIIAAIRTGKYCFDYWEDDVPTYWVRPATCGNEGKVVHASWGGRCTLLTVTGCSLSFERRPYQCRDLLPSLKASIPCVSGSGMGTKDKAKEAWLPYQEMILDLIDSLES